MLTGELLKPLFLAHVKVVEEAAAFVPLSDVISGLKTALFVSTNAEDFTAALPIRAGRIHVSAQHFPPGSVAVFSYGVGAAAASAATWLRTEAATLATEAVKGADFDGINVLLYRCEPEEFDTTGSRGYDVPGLGKLPYCGVASLRALLDTDVSLGHALCAHLRSGDWLLGFLGDRLEQKPSLAPVRAYFRAVLERCVDSRP